MAASPAKIPRTCSQCGNNGHNARTCTEHSPNNNPAAASSNGFMLFGVRMTAGENSAPSSPCAPVPPPAGFRKCMSMNNLAQYEQQIQHSQDSPNNGDVGAAGYASDDALHASGSHSRERKRGIPWTEDEHKMFLLGLSKVGKGDWRGISRNFVKTRTPTQVASHAQKYFLRKTNLNRRRRRSSLFDITAESICRSSSEGQLQNLALISQAKPATIPTTRFPVLQPIATNDPRSIPLPAPSAKMAKLNLNQSPTSSPTSSTSTNSAREKELEPFLSLKLSPAPSDEESSRHSSAFGGFNSSGDSIISVA